VTQNRATIFTVLISYSQGTLKETGVTSVLGGSPEAFNWFEVFSVPKVSRNVLKAFRNVSKVFRKCSEMFL
jgi:hypothetical protein